MDADRDALARSRKRPLSILQPATVESSMDSNTVPSLHRHFRTKRTGELVSTFSILSGERDHRAAELEELPESLFLNFLLVNTGGLSSDIFWKIVSVF